MRALFTRVSGALAPIFRALSPVVFAVQSILALVALLLYPILMGIVGIVFVAAFWGGPEQFALWLAVFFGLTIGLIVTSQIKTKWLVRAAAIIVVTLQLIELGVIVDMALAGEGQIWIDLLTWAMVIALTGGQFNLWWLLRHHQEIWTGTKMFFTRLAAWILSWLRRGATPVAGPVAALGRPHIP